MGLMSGPLQTKFYLEQAARAQSEADAAVLSKVKERAMRSFTAWQALADQAVKTESLRSKLAEEKAAKAVLDARQSND